MGQALPSTGVDGIGAGRKSDSSVWPPGLGVWIKEKAPRRRGTWRDGTGQFLRISGMRLIFDLVFKRLTLDPLCQMSSWTTRSPTGGGARPAMGQGLQFLLAQP